MKIILLDLKSICFFILRNVHRNLAHRNEKEKMLFDSLNTISTVDIFEKLQKKMILFYFSQHVQGFSLTVSTENLKRLSLKNFDQDLRSAFEALNVV